MPPNDALEQRLIEFVTNWQPNIRGDEKGEAQIFLDRLFAALGYPGGIKGAAGESEKRIKFRLNDVAAREARGEAVTPPGIPPSYAARGGVGQHGVHCGGGTVGTCFCASTAVGGF